MIHNNDQAYKRYAKIKEFNRNNRIKTKEWKNDNKVRIKCGGQERHVGNWLNIDKYDLDETDMKVDLDELPLPFKSDSVDEIKCLNVLEHIVQPFDLLMEFHRILKKGGKIEIQVPFYNHPRGYSDMTHIHYFSYDIIEGILDFMVTLKIEPFKIVYKKIHYSRFAPIKCKWIGHFIPNYITFIDWVIEK